MCGIAGIINLKGQEIFDAQARIRRMTSLLNHRGPDDQGSYISLKGHIALGNTRLAISDPLNHIPQPLKTTNGKFVINFNGELYNDLELRQGLEEKGVSFRSHLDTEVLLEGLRLEGEDFLHKIDGMWAFVFYDEEKNSVLLSRDVLGERHLFYRITKDEFIFSSEVNSLIADARDALEIDFDNVLQSFLYGIAPVGETIIKGIRRMLPGHNMIINIGQQPREYLHRKLHPEVWFDFFKRKPSLEETIGTFEKVFDLVCKRRIPREVPYISTLSGGVDSALVALYVSDFGRKETDTIFALSEATPQNKLPGDLPEYEASRITAGVVKSRHHTTRLDAEGSLNALNDLAENAFDGMFDEAAGSFEMLARGGRVFEKKVMLISDGPDEFSGGYTCDKEAFVQDVKGGVKLNSCRHIYQKPFHQIVPKETLKQAVEGSVSVKNHRVGFGCFYKEYSGLLPELDNSQIRALIYAASTIPDYCNLRADRGFMRASVESRSPYLAPKMVEFLIAMPAKFRFGPDNATTKYFMREIVKKYISVNVASRSKHPFSAPLWFNPGMKEKIRFEETIRESFAWKAFPFSKIFQENIFNEPFYKMRWSFYSLTKTQEHLKVLSRKK